MFKKIIPVLLILLVYSNVSYAADSTKDICYIFQDGEYIYTDLELSEVNSNYKQYVMLRLWDTDGNGKFDSLQSVAVPSGRGYPDGGKIISFFLETYDTANLIYEHGQEYTCKLTGFDFSGLVEGDLLPPEPDNPADERPEVINIAENVQAIAINIDKIRLMLQCFLLLFIAFNVHKILRITFNNLAKGGK